MGCPTEGSCDANDGIYEYSLLYVNSTKKAVL